MLCWPHRRIVRDGSALRGVFCDVEILAGCGPRTRGDDPSGSVAMVRADRWSPHTRGCFPHAAERRPRGGAVPARAGRSYRVAGFGRGRPISVMGRECMTPLLNSWFAKNDALYVGNFAMRPIPLFPGRLDPRRSLLVAGLRPRLKGRDWATMYSKAPIAGRIGGLCGIIGGVRSVTEKCKIISIY